MTDRLLSSAVGLKGSHLITSSLEMTAKQSKETQDWLAGGGVGGSFWITRMVDQKGNQVLEYARLPV